MRKVAYWALSTCVIVLLFVCIFGLVSFLSNKGYVQYSSLLAAIFVGTGLTITGLLTLSPRSAFQRIVRKPGISGKSVARSAYLSFTFSGLAFIAGGIHYYFSQSSMSLVVALWIALLLQILVGLFAR
jgi:hypothetical protein